MVNIQEQVIMARVRYLFLKSTTSLEFQISAMTSYVHLAVVIQPSGLIFVHL